MNYIGISAGFHDAALSVIDSNGNITFAGHSERYSKQKHDKHLSMGIVEDALTYCDSSDVEIHYYERPWMKFLRQVRSGEKPKLSSLSVKDTIGTGLLHKLQDGCGGKVHTHNHHLSHAAAGFQTSPYDDATVVVIDAIGEFDTISIWNAWYDKNGKAQYKKLWGRKYPDSIGLFYSAMTERVGLRPLDEEYILMGMAAYGDPKPVDKMSKELIESYTVNVSFLFKDLLFTVYLISDIDFNIALLYESYLETSFIFKFNNSSFLIKLKVYSNILLPSNFDSNILNPSL
jgi:carbamoyltransferase